MRWTKIALSFVAGLSLAACSSSGQGRESTSAPENVQQFKVGEELDPGKFASRVFETPATFTVPGGWKVFEDEPGQLGLARIANDGPPLLILRDIDAAAAGCITKPEQGVGREAADLSQWLTDRKGLVTTEPVPVLVGGLSGYVMDVSLDPSWTKTCPDITPEPSVMTIVGSPPLSSGVLWGPERARMQRMWFLDLPTVENGNIVVMGDVCCGVDEDDQLSADQEIVDSLSFDTT